MKLPARIVNENSVSEVPGKKALPVTVQPAGPASMIFPNTTR
jgi:hypothetical protein